MPKQPFALSRATPDDMPEITRLEYVCFPPIVRELFMGCQTEDDLPRLSARHARLMATDRHDVWIKVVETRTRRIIAASNWKVYPNGAPSSAGDTAPEWLRDEDRERAARMLGAMNEARRAANPGGFVYLHTCFTDPEYQRRGAGSMMMQWGCDLADQLFLPAWIEASPEGNALYRKYGFYDLEPARGGLQGTNMRRDARTKQGA
ncbi:acyl-CoA N-acyltransferase [Xylariomycetidae sp. FL2044]|nr:acyl-CoA N-acyltransferase [Xylariomycetidae sp. FL2044]